MCMCVRVCVVIKCTVTKGHVKYRPWWPQLLSLEPFVSLTSYSREMTTSLHVVLKWTCS